VIHHVIGEVDAGRTQRGIGSVLGQLYNVLLRAVEVERKIKESVEFAERLEEVERRLDAPNIPNVSGATRRGPHAR
jgi:hypothetical protein